MSVARSIADQRTSYRVPHTVVCALLGVSLAWFYKWLALAQGPNAVMACTPPGTGAATPSTAPCGSRSARLGPCTVRRVWSATCVMRDGG